MQKIFDAWNVYIDPNIDNLAYRVDTAATTKFHDKRTQFNYKYFNLEGADLSSEFIFIHEFRHLMEENNAPSSLSDFGQVLIGRPGDSRYE